MKKSGVHIDFTNPEAVERWGWKLGCYNPDFTFMTLANMNEATRLFAAAGSVRNDPPLGF